MTLKVRVEGSEEEINWLVEGLREIYDVRSVSRFYTNRDGKIFRVYVEMFPFLVKSGSCLDSKNLESEGDEVEATPRPGDVVLGGDGISFPTEKPPASFKEIPQT